jgi:hypothetical protein
MSKNNELVGYEATFLKFLRKHQNSSVSLAHDLSHLEPRELSRKFQEILKSNEAISFNAFDGAPADSKELTMMSNFHDEEYCALVPFQSNKSFLDNMLSPYENLVWILCLVTLFVGSIVWQFIRSRARFHTNSTWDFLFNILGLFLLQSPSLPHLHPLQRSILQLLVFGTFILGTAYQSQIVTLMFESRNRTSINNMEALTTSDLNLAIESSFVQFLDPRRRDRVTMFDSDLLSVNDLTGFASNDTAVVLRCDLISLLKVRIGKIFDEFYMMNGRYNSHLKFYTINRKNAFNDKIYELSLKYFETGIRDHDRYTVRNFLNIGRLDKFIESDYYLNFGDLWGAFVILIAGLSLSFLVFLVELIVHRLRRRNFEKPRISWLELQKKMRARSGSSLLKIRKSPMKQKSSGNYTNVKIAGYLLMGNQVILKCVHQSRKISDDRKLWFPIKFVKSGRTNFDKKNYYF